MPVKYFILGGKKYLWKEILKMGHEQIKAARRAAQVALFALQDDAGPKYQRAASARFEDPHFLEI
jgi:hypothetical protein